MIAGQAYLLAISEQCILVFVYILAALPLMKIRGTSKETLAVGGCVTAMLALVLGIGEESVGVPSNDIDMLILVAAVFVYKRYSKLGWSQTLFVIFTSGAALSYVIMWAVIVDAVTVGNSVSQQYLALPGALVQWAGSFLCLALLWRFVKDKMPQMLLSNATRNARLYWRASWIIPAVLFAVTVYARPENPETLAVNRVLPVLIAGIIALLAMAIAFYVASYRLVETTNKNIELSELQKKASMEKMYAEHLDERISEARRANHDLRQFLAVLESCAEQNDMEGFLEYSKRLQRELPSSSAILYCENRIINMVTLYYCDLVRQLGANPDVLMKVSQNSPYTPVELTALFGNLLENAYEALKREVLNGANPDQLVFRVRAMQEGNKPLVVTVDNSCSMDVALLADGSIESSKHGGMGNGTDSISNIARRHNGHAQFECEDGIFKASVFLSMP